MGGEIRHYLRDQGSVVRRPRWFHELDHRVRQVATTLTQRLGRLPLVSEIADELGIPVQWVLQAARTREAFRFMSLDEVREDGDGAPVTPYDRLSGDQLSGPCAPRRCGGAALRHAAEGHLLPVLLGPHTD